MFNQVTLTLGRSVIRLKSVSQNNPETNSLYLYPKIPDWNTDPESLISTLGEIGLIDKKIPDTSNCFFAGDELLNHITFLGCAPAIQFDATDDKPDFCFIRLINSKDIRMIHTSSLSRSPHCPHCTKTLKQWQELSIEEPWICPHCTHPAPAHTYDWRRTAGFACIFIEINDIYPKEAMPQPALLDKLASLTGIEWDYFYYCV